MKRKIDYKVILLIFLVIMLWSEFLYYLGVELKVLIKSFLIVFSISIYLLREYIFINEI